MTVSSSQQNYPGTVKSLIQTGADVNRQDTKNSTALMFGWSINILNYFKLLSICFHSLPFWLHKYGQFIDPGWC